MTRKTQSPRRQRRASDYPTDHVPHWSWTWREPERQGNVTTLAPEDFWSRLGL